MFIVITFPCFCVKYFVVFFYYFHIIMFIYLIVKQIWVIRIADPRIFRSACPLRALPAYSFFFFFLSSEWMVSSDIPWRKPYHSSQQPFPRNWPGPVPFLLYFSPLSFLGGEEEEGGVKEEKERLGGGKERGRRK